MNLLLFFAIHRETCDLTIGLAKLAAKVADYQLDYGRHLLAGDPKTSLTT